MCGQPRLVELYKMAASASGEYPFAFTIARIARQLQGASDGGGHRYDDIMPGLSGSDGDRTATAVNIGPFQSANFSGPSADEQL